MVKVILAIKGVLECRDVKNKFGKKPLDLLSTEEMRRIMK